MGKGTDLATQQADFKVFMGRLAKGIIPEGRTFASISAEIRKEAFQKITVASLGDKPLNEGFGTRMDSIYHSISKGNAGDRIQRGGLVRLFVAQMGYDYDSGKRIKGEQEADEGREKDGKAKGNAKGEKAPKSYSMGPQHIKIEGIEKYRNNFILIMMKFGKLLNREQFDLLPNKKRAELFGEPKLRKFVESTGANQAFEKGAKISYVMKLVKDRLRDSNLLRKGSTLPTMIYLFGYDPRTGEILANRKTQEAKQIAVKSSDETAIVEEPSEIEKMATEAGDSMAAAVKASRVIDCGKHFDAIHRALSEASVGETVALYLGRRPDKLFMKALFSMGFDVTESYSKPSYHSLTGLEYDGAHLIIAKRASEICNATPIMLANGVSRTNAILDEIHRLLGIAENQAKTTGDVGLLHKTADDLLSLLKKEKANKLHDKVLEAFTSIDATKGKAAATDPEILKIAKDRMLNPGIKNIGLAKQRKESAHMAKTLSKR